MEIILEDQKVEHSSLISSFSICTESNAERIYQNVTTVTAGLVNVYTRGEVDVKIAEVQESIDNLTSRRTKFNATEGQTQFDMGGDIAYIENVTRNGVDLDPNIFIINSPYIQYNASMNDGNDLVLGDIIIFNIR